MFSKVFCLNELGKRQNIEDSLYPPIYTASVTSTIFLVCDGVGGESKGEEASRILCEIAGKNLEGKKVVSEGDIKSAVSLAIAEMKRYISAHPGSENMSTTLTVAARSGSGIMVGWCGDSRVYHISNGKISWKSKDHSLVQFLIDSGELAPENAARHPQRNVITRSINAAADVSNIDFHFIANAKEGDYLLLCTDGLLENTSDTDIEAFLYNHPEEDKEVLFKERCEGVARDNYSMYLLQLNKSFEESRKSSKKTWIVIGIALAIGLTAWALLKK